VKVQSQPFRYLLQVPASPCSPVIEDLPSTKRIETKVISEGKKNSAYETSEFVKGRKLELMRNRVLPEMLMYC
jgi:hypothetical protein